MTFIELEEAAIDQKERERQNDRTVKCGWCGDIIRLDGKELALAICQICYERMLADFRRQQQLNEETHARDRWSSVLSSSVQFVD
jgi:hypothetical protein